jgi:hypothetical protein
MILAALVLSGLIGGVMGGDYYRQMTGKSEFANGALSGALFQGGLAAVVLAVTLVIGCIIWWRIAWRKPNHLTQPTLTGG